MNNLKKTISRIMIIALTVSSLMSGVSAMATTKGTVVPQPAVSGLKVTYKYNSKIKFNISTPNYTRKVKYKIALYNFNTKKSIDLTKGYSKSMGGSKIFTLSAIPKAAGKYSIRIYVKALASKKSYDKYLEKVFTIEANISAIKSEILNAATLENSIKVGIQIGNVKSSDKEKIQSVINESIAMKDNIYASQREVDSKIQTLKVAENNFKSAIKQPVDNTALITTIKAAQQKLNSVALRSQPLEFQIAIKNYKNALSEEIGNSIKVVVDRNATEQSVREAVIALNNEITVFADQIKGIGSNS